MSPADGTRPGAVARLLALAEAARPLNSVFAAVAVAAGGLIVPAFSAADAPGLLLAAGVALLVTAGGNVVNDLFDAEIDRVNRPGRPIPSGRLTERAAAAASAALLASSLLGALVNPVVLAIAVLNAAVLVAYSWRLKGIPLAGNAAVSYLVGSTFLFGGAAVGGALEALPLFLLAFLATLGREVVKDVEDLPGDRGRVSTLATELGPGRASLFGAAALAACVASSPLPFVAGVLSAWFLPFAAAADAALAYAAASLLRNPTVEEAGRAQRRVKLGMVLALAGFVAGAL